MAGKFLLFNIETCNKNAKDGDFQIIQMIVMEYLKRFKIPKNKCTHNFEPIQGLEMLNLTYARSPLTILLLTNWMYKLNGREFEKFSIYRLIFYSMNSQDKFVLLKAVILSVKMVEPFQLNPDGWLANVKKEPMEYNVSTL